MYVQSDDLFGNLDQSFKDTIRFGLVTKFVLNSIFPAEIN